MELKRSGDWVQLADGRWANLDHCDLIEVREADGGWELVAWNARQAHLDAYVIAEFKSDKEARKALDAMAENLD